MPLVELLVILEYGFQKNMCIVAAEFRINFVLFSRLLAVILSVSLLPSIFLNRRHDSFNMHRKNKEVSGIGRNEYNSNMTYESKDLITDLASRLKRWENTWKIYLRKTEITMTMCEIK